jgi:hypothetical protein
MSIPFRDTLKDALLKFVEGGHADVAQERACHFGEHRPEIEPGAALRRVYVLESPRTSCQAGYGGPGEKLADVLDRVELGFVQIDHHARMIDPKSSFEPLEKHLSSYGS